MNTKKDIFQKHKTPKSKSQNSHEQSAYIQRINKLNSSAAYFKDVKTEEAFSGQDQKLVETTKL